MTRKRLASFVVALTFGALAALMATGALPCPKIAQAYVPDNPSKNLTQAQKIQVFRYWMGQTQIPETGTETQKAKGERFRRMWTRAKKKGMPNLGPQLLTKTNLATVAAGVWLHNGVALYCGFVSGNNCTPELVMDSEYRQASGASGPAGGFFEYRESDGTLVGAGAMTSATYTYSPETDTCRVQIQYSGQSTASHNSMGYSGLGSISGSGGTGCSYNKRHTTDGGVPFVVEVSPAQPGTADKQFTVGSTYPLTYTPVGEPFRADQSYTWNAPVYDSGSMTEAPPEYTPASGDYLATDAESDATLDALRADPEYNPATDDPPEVAPELSPREAHDKRVSELTPTRGPAEWTTENPDGSVTTRFRDGTEFTSWPDGTELLKDATGREDWKYPDGTTRQYDPSTGTETTTWPDGTTRTRNYPPGTPSTGLETATPTGETWRDATGTPTTSGDPTTYPEPPVTAPPPTGGTSQGSDTCASPREFTFDLPEMKLGSIFPFSLILRAWEWMQALAAPPERPSFTLPFFGTITVSDGWDFVAASIRAVLAIVFGIGMSFWFYRYISGKGSE